MSFCNQFLLAHFFIFLSGMATADITSGWETPFLDAVTRLKANDWQRPMMSKNKFAKNSTTTLKRLKKNKKEWQVFIDQKNSGDGSSSIDENSYISTIFQTKANTLVFKTTYQPHAIIKIDQRTPEELGDNLRTYFHAYEKTQAVQKMNIFSHLYLPIEYGKKSKKTSLKYVFSEEVPLFSESEIDNIALLVIMLNAVDHGDKHLEKELKLSFSQMLQYICHVDFDDINYRNVPFAKDGRLAPIDVDSYRAATGVFSFIEYFFAVKLFSLTTVLNIIPKDCSAKLKIPCWSNPYFDEKRIESAHTRFNETRDYFNNIIEFLKTRKARIAPRIAAYDEETEPYVDIVNVIIEKKIFDSSEKKLLFGWRCEHARDLITEAAHGIRKKQPTISVAQADNIVRQILAAGKKDKIFISYADLSIQDIENAEGIRGFICF